MKKFFIKPETIKLNGYKMAYELYKSGFIPDIIYVSLRGGALLGNCISEFYKLKLPKDHKPILYGSVVAHSYNGFESSGNVRIDGWTYSPEYLRPGDKVLLIDDLWDTGTTLTALEKELMSKGVERKNLKVCVHDFKVRSFLLDKPDPLYLPDIWAKQYLIDDPEYDVWFHYESHELVGLTDEELLKVCDESLFDVETLKEILIDKKND